MKKVFSLCLAALVCALLTVSPAGSSAFASCSSSAASMSTPSYTIYLRQPNGTYANCTSTTVVSGNSLYDLSGGFIGTLSEEESGGTIKGISGAIIGWFTSAV